MLPAKWEALRRGIEFWVQVMRMKDDRLVKVVMLEALEIGSKVKWVNNLQQSLEKLEWRGLNVVTLDGMTIKEMKQLLKDTAWRRVKSVWREKAKGSSKLEMTGKLMDNECKARCVGMDCKRRRRMMAKLRGGTAEFGMEIGRWHGLGREDRVCKECGNGDMEDTEHFVMRCKALNREREELMEKVKKVVTGLDEVEEERNVTWILDLACRNESIARGVEKLWTARFVEK